MLGLPLVYHQGGKCEQDTGFSCGQLLHLTVISLLYSSQVILVQHFNNFVKTKKMLGNKCVAYNFVCDEELQLPQALISVLCYIILYYTSWEARRLPGHEWQ